MFDPTKIYLATDDALKVLGVGYWTLARWRCEGRGPAYIKIGNKVAYSGDALNTWLQERTIRPKGLPPKPKTPAEARPAA